jgi:hypothetical protein
MLLNASIVYVLILSLWGILSEEFSIQGNVHNHTFMPFIQLLLNFIFCIPIKVKLVQAYWKETLKLLRFLPYVAMMEFLKKQTGHHSSNRHTFESFIVMFLLLFMASHVEIFKQSVSSCHSQLRRICFRTVQHSSHAPKSKCDIHDTICFSNTCVLCTLRCIFKAIERNTELQLSKHNS